MKFAAENEEVLIPIRLDLELDNYRLKDVFTWNMNGTFFLLRNYTDLALKRN